VRRLKRDLAQPSPNFHRGQKVRNLASFKTSLNFEPHALGNAARYPKSETKVQCCDDRPMSWPRLVKLDPEKALPVLSCTPPTKITREKRAKSSITQQWIIRFRSNFV